jgi:hypothetical protein
VTPNEIYLVSEAGFELAPHDPHDPRFKEPSNQRIYRKPGNALCDPHATKSGQPCALGSMADTRVCTCKTATCCVHQNDTPTRIRLVDTAHRLAHCPCTARPGPASRELLVGCNTGYVKHRVLWHRDSLQPMHDQRREQMHCICICVSLCSQNPLPLGVS